MGDSIAQMVHPDHILKGHEVDALGEFEAVYPLTQGITLRVMSKAIKSALSFSRDLDEWIDPNLMEEKGWASWIQALGEAHNPRGNSETSPEFPARERLAYDEFFAHQLTLALAGFCKEMWGPERPSWLFLSPWRQSRRVGRRPSWHPQKFWLSSILPP